MYLNLLIQTEKSTGERLQISSSKKCIADRLYLFLKNAASSNEVASAAESTAFAHTHYHTKQTSRGSEATLPHPPPYEEIDKRA